MSAATTDRPDTTDRADTLLFSSSRKREWNTLLRHTVVIGGLTAFLVLATWGAEPYYQLEIGKIVAYLAVSAGLTVLIGLNGQLSLGHSALMAVGGYTTAIMQAKLADSPSLYGWRIIISVVLAVALTTVVGVFVGVAAARLRGPYLAGASLALVGVLLPIGTMVKSFKGDQGLKVPLDPRPLRIEYTHLGPYYVQAQQWKTWLIIGFTLPAMILLANLVKSRYGRNFRAVRDDEVAAKLVGINVARTQVTAFVVSSAMAGVSGAMFGIIYQQANPLTFGIVISLYMLLGIVLGGIGSLWGAVWGSILIVALPDWLSSQARDVAGTNALLFNRLNGNLALFLFGVGLILVILLAPGGLQALFMRIINWARRPFQQGGASSS